MRLFIRDIYPFILTNTRDEQGIWKRILRQSLGFEHGVKNDAWPIDGDVVEHGIYDHKICFTALCVVCTMWT